MPVATAKSLCFDIPVPWSQVTKRESSPGRRLIALGRQH